MITQKKANHTYIKIIIITTIIEFALSLGFTEKGMATISPFLAIPYYGKETISQYFGGGHNGIDFGTVDYEPVLASADGDISQVKWYNNNCHQGGVACGYGLHIFIDHANNYQTIYGHLSTTSFEINSTGKSVKQGMVIGTSGHNGYSTGPHLHFEVRHNGTPVNPFNESNVNLWLDEETSVSLFPGKRPIPTPASGNSYFVDNTSDNSNGFSKGSGGFPNNPCTGNCGGWTSRTEGYQGDMYYTPANGGTTPDQWARWKPTLPGHSRIYDIFIHVPNVDNGIIPKTWQGVYNVNDNTGVLQGSGAVDEYGLPASGYSISEWVSIGFHYYLMNNALVYATDATKESSNQHCYPNTWCNSTADAVKFVQRGTTYLPDIRQTGGGVYAVSNIVVHNSGAGRTDIKNSFYNISGSYKSGSWPTLERHGYGIYSTSDSTGAYAIVDARQDEAVISNNQTDEWSQQSAYTGIRREGGSPGWEQAGTILYAPLLKSNRYGRTSELSIVNTGTSSTYVDIYYYRTNGSFTNYQHTQVAPGGEYRVVPPLSLCPDPEPGGDPGGLCSAKIVSTESQPLAAVVREYNTTTLKEVATYNIFSSGADVIYYPLVKYNRYNYTTGLGILNVGSASTNITVAFYEKGVGYTCSLPTYNNVGQYAMVIPQFTSTCPGTGTDGNGFVGSVVVSSSDSQPLVGMASESNVTGESQKKSYSAFLAGSKTAYAPLVYGNQGNWDGGITIMSIGSTAHVTVCYYDDFGYEQGSCSTGTISNNMIQLFYAPDYFTGSAVITSDQNIAVVVNFRNKTSSGDTHAFYNAPAR